MNSKIGNIILAAISVTLVLILCKSCFDNESTITPLHKEYENQKIIVDSVTIVNKHLTDSLENVIDSLNSSRSHLSSLLKKFQAELDSVNEVEPRSPSTIDSMVVYFNKKYDKGFATADGNRVSLDSILSSNTIKNLNTLPIKNYVISLKDRQINTLDSMNTNLKSVVSSKNSILQANNEELRHRRVLEKAADRNIANLQKNLKKARKRKKAWMYSVPIAIIVGGVTGYLITK